MIAAIEGTIVGILSPSAFHRWAARCVQTKIADFHFFTAQTYSIFNSVHVTPGGNMAVRIESLYLTIGS